MTTAKAGNSLALPTITRRAALKGAAAAAVTGLAFGGSAQAQSPVKLSIWTGFPEIEPFYKSAAAEFTKSHPNAEIDVFSTSLREFEQKLTAAIPSGTGPNVFDVGPFVAIKLIKAGLIDPNTPETEQHLKSGAWTKDVVDYLTIEGKSYGLPLMQAAHGAFYYNKSMFKEAGIAEPPKTFAELIAAAVKLTKRDGDGKMIRSGISMRLSGQGSGITEKFRYVLEPAGGSIITQTSSGKWRSNFDNDAGRTALQFYVDVVQKDMVDDPKIVHDGEAFVAEKTAMLFRESWVIGEILSKNPSLDYGVVPIPAWNGARKMQSMPYGIYVNGKSDNKDIAQEFAKFLTSKENAPKLTATSGWLSDRTDADWQPLIEKTPQFQAFLAPPSDVEFYVDPILECWDEIQTRLADQLTAAYVNPELNGNPDKVAQTIKDMAALADGLLKENDVYDAG
jgi:multiple sugar transport system substrate-binding protein